MKDIQTQTTDVSIQTINQTKPDSSGKNTQKPAKPTERTKTNSSPQSSRSKSPKKIQTDQVPKGSDDEIKKFNRLKCLDEDTEADTYHAEQNRNEQGRITKINNR